MVFRRFRGNSLRPINRIKHVIDNQGGIAATAGTTIVLALASDTPDLASVTECQTGSKVNGIYIKVEAVRTTATSGVLGNVYLAVFKDPGGNLAIPTINAIGASDDKRYIIHQEMVMLTQTANSNPRIIFNGVVKIPRGYTRMGPNDKISLRLLTPGVAINFCLQAHYKEFR